MPAGRPRKPVDFDANRHCGHPVFRRDPERLTKVLHKAQHRLKHLKPSDPTYLVKKDHHQRVIKTATAFLEELEKHPDDRPCVNLKGTRTDHQGEGYCYRHCSCHGRRGWHNVTGSVYRQIKHAKLQDALALVDTQTVDVMDLVPEAKMLKALIVVITEDVNHKKLGLDEMKGLVEVIDKIGRTVERINSIRVKTGLVTFHAVEQLTAEMGRYLTQVAGKWDGKTFSANEFLMEVRALWGSISIETTAKALLPKQSERSAEDG